MRRLVKFSTCVAATLLLAVSAQACCWLDLYWPLNGGDYRTFVYGTQSLTVSTEDYGFGQYRVYYSSPEDSAYEIQEVDGCVLYTVRMGANGGWIKIGLNPRIYILDENMLKNGGSHTTSTTVSQTGATPYPATFTVTVALAGTVTVPAGTFQNCRNITVTERATIPGYGNVTVTALTAVLAPRAGMIKKLVKLETGDVWASLTSGTVGGVDVRTLGASSGILPPGISTQPRNTTATNNGQASLSVTATGQSLRYRWLKSGTPLVDDGRVTGTTNSILKIKPVHLSDAGSYSVLVENAACSLLSTNAALTVVPDTNKPTVTIQSPANNSYVSNATVQVSGKATDNIGVDRVMVWVAGDLPVQATGTTNWTSSVWMKPGTNLLYAQSFDLEDNASIVATNTVILFAGERLTLRIDLPAGGTVSGVSNAQSLGINLAYKATANSNGAAGFVFAHWAQSTNGTDWLTSRVQTLNFTMQSNLLLVAGFVDARKPTLAIANPVANSRVSNAVVNVAGTAQDNDRVAAVWVSVNAAAFELAQTSNLWTNWVLPQQTLIPGTNLVQAYAVDATGNVSLTNSTRFTYMVSDLLEVRTIGRGTLAPNYSNAWLAVGTNYSMTATGTNGHKFSFWIMATNWIDGVITNHPTVKFLMQSNLTLTAVFVDTNRPTLTVTNLAANQRLSNTLFAVKGTATDNVGVSQVWHRLNGGDWTPAEGASSWEAPLVLVQRSNTFQAYAEDAAGNRSVTSSVAFLYVTTGRLEVRSVGHGTLTPNYSNAVLEIGKDYTITAAPTSGHAFRCWEVSTNWVAPIMATNRALKFLMQSNLTLTAVCADTNRPVVTITNPAANARYTNGLAAVKGTARDNVQVQAVWCQLNGAEWTMATTTNGWTNWMAMLPLRAGTNTVRAYALDVAGNVSLTNSVSCMSSNAFQLSLSLGQVHPDEGCDLSLALSPGLSGRLEVSTDLVHWDWLANFTGTNALMRFRDPAAAIPGQRFYRAVVP